MSKKHSGSSRGAQQKNDKRLNDPDFAGKKVVKKPSNKTQNQKNASDKKSEKPSENVNKPKKRSKNSPKHSAGNAVSAKSLHNKDVKKQTATKKPPIVLPKEDNKAGEEIVVKTVKKDDQKKNNSAAKSARAHKIEVTTGSPEQSKPKAENYKPDTSAPKKAKPLKNKNLTPKAKIDREIPPSRGSIKKPSASQAAVNAPVQPKKFNWRKTWRKHPMPAILRIPCLVLLLAGASILFTWFIFWRTNSCDTDEVARFIGEKPMLFSYSCLIIFFIMAVTAAITWHVFFTIGLSFAAASIITFISMQKFQLREEPLLPGDFAFAGQTGNLIGMIDAGAIWRLIGGVILVLIGSILLEIYACKMLGKRLKGRPWWEKHSLLPRITYTTISLAGLVMTVNPILKHENPEWLEGLTKIAWDQTQSYGYNGFVLDFVSNIRKTAAPKPHDYSRETIMKIAEKYWAIKEADDENRKPLDEIADRIFIILDESFYDPTLVKEYYDYGKNDVLPVTHEIFENYPSGFMYSPGYGGSTANIEFEVQTGYSNYWSNSYPYIDVVSKSDSILSVANWAKNYGFDAKAIHSYWGDMYSRDTAYPILGYDEFIDISQMPGFRSEPGTTFPNDSDIFERSIDLADENSPILLNIVTMQNHAGYTTQNYPQYNFTVTTGKQKDEITKYYQLLHSTDTYLGEMIEELEKSKEKTVILWFGDHAAGVYPELAESDDKTERDLTRLTPYFIWTNFDLDSDSKKTLAEIAEQTEELGFDLSAVKGVDLPTTTPNCLLNRLYNTLGAEKPALFYLLDEVCKEAPIITGTYYSDGSALPDSEVLKEYELVNYDIMNGHQYWDGN